MFLNPYIIYDGKKVKVLLRVTYLEQPWEKSRLTCPVKTRWVTSDKLSRYKPDEGNLQGY